jgi:excisionase family DNA binding protein
MEELLTTKQVQELLQVDRTTIYRMINDGRLTGVKIGKQWRFPKGEVKALLSGVKKIKPQDTPFSTDVLPLHCIQSIQDVFAEIGEIGSITVSPSGEPLTKMSNPSNFCNLILSTEKGRKGCMESWYQLSKQPTNHTGTFTCHTGLQCIFARIEIYDRLSALLLACQFKTNDVIEPENEEFISQLAKKFNLDQNELLTAFEDIPIIDPYTKSRISKWLEKVANTFEDIGVERADLISRLKQISAMSTLEP